jgi:hypothetical protein
VSWLAERAGGRWEGEGVPASLVLEPGNAARPAVRAIPAAVLVEAWRWPWLSRGLEPPPATVTELRRELEKRAANGLRDAPRTELRPISQVAFETGVPERTLRARIMRGAVKAELNGRGQLAFEMPVRRTIRVPLVASIPDPRVLMLMVSEGCKPGGLHRVGYRRRRDGELWKERW